MTGPEHYKAAEQVLETIDNFDSTDPVQQPVVAQLIAEAHVHATLAAATALSQFGEFPAYDAEAWLNTASTQPMAVEDLDGEVAAPEADADRTGELILLAEAILASFTQGQDGYRARVGQVQIQRWRAALDGGDQR